MGMSVRLEQLEGKRLVGTARHHTVITDRPREEGGGDAGCSSGELLLMAIGSCATGSLRSFLEGHGRRLSSLSVEVAFEPSRKAGARDRIVITLGVDPDTLGFPPHTIAEAATSGGVNSRMKLGSEIEVRFAGRHGAASE